MNTPATVMLVGGPRDGELLRVPDHVDSIVIPAPGFDDAHDIAEHIRYRRTVLVAKAEDFCREYRVYVHGQEPDQARIVEIARMLDHLEALDEEARRESERWEAKNVFVPICDCDSKYCSDGFLITYGPSEPQGDPEFVVDSLRCSPTREHLVKIHEAIGKWLEETGDNGGDPLEA